MVMSEYFKLKKKGIYRYEKNQEAESFGVIGLGRFGTALAITIAKAART